MTYLPVTPFRRSVNAALLAHQSLTHEEDTHPIDVRVNKWEVLRLLAQARKTYDLSDRDLSVLRGLLTFYPETDLRRGELIIYPSNITISERLNHMPLSTLRRHIAKLVTQGFLIRRDSPNGKRYVRKTSSARQAFGFDLSPLLFRAEEIGAAADHIQQLEDEIRQLRESVSLMRRDLASLADYGELKEPDLLDWSELRSVEQSAQLILRRRPERESLMAAMSDLTAALNLVRSAFEAMEPAKMSTKRAQNEHHYHNSNKDTYESEATATEMQTSAPSSQSTCVKRRATIPLGVVLNLCKEVQAYTETPIQSWNQLIRTTDKLHKMMGITEETWDNAKKTLGAEEASIVLASMLERFNKIRSPGAYLRYLTNKALQQRFTAGPMLRALAIIT